jgi:hypothetical protein
MTHYITKAAQFSVRAKVVYAVCGSPASRSQHSTDPDCPGCRAWLAPDDPDVPTVIKDRLEEMGYPRNTKT